MLVFTTSYRESTYPGPYLLPQYQATKGLPRIMKQEVKGKYNPSLPAPEEPVENAWRVDFQGNCGAKGAPYVCGSPVVICAHQFPLKKEFGNIRRVSYF